MVMLYPSPPNSPQPEEAQVIILLSNTEKSISCCTGRSAASFIRELKESVFAMCSVTQGRREKQEQPWRYVGSFRNTREGTGWRSGADLPLSAGHWCCLIAQRNVILPGIILLLKSFTSLGILNKKHSTERKSKAGKWSLEMTKLKLSYDPVPDDVIAYVCRAGSKEELDPPSQRVMVEPCLIHYKGWMVCALWDMWPCSKQWA